MSNPIQQGPGGQTILDHGGPEPVTSDTHINVRTGERQRLHAEQVEQLFSLWHVGFIATLVNVSILTIVQWNVISHSVLLTWFSALVLITLLRDGLLFRYRPTPIPPDESRRWSVWFIGSIAIVGIAWGSAAVFLFPEESLPHQIFLAFVLGGMMAGAAATYSVLYGAFLAFSVPALTPIIVRFFALGDDIHIAMGSMMVLFGAMMFVTARRIHTTTVASLRLRFENRDLVGYLSDAKERAENLNESLRSEIIERTRAEEQLARHREHLEVTVKERTAQLRESEGQYRLLAENVTDVIWLIDLGKGVLTYISPSVERVWGYTPAEAMDLQLEGVLMPSSREMALSIIQQELAQESTENPDRPRSRTLELEHRRKNGSTGWAEVNVTFLRDSHGRVCSLLGVSRDISHRKRVEEEKRGLESQLLQAKKMEAIGTLAGGIAHDFNNLLTSINGYSDLLLLRVGPDDPLRRYVQEIKESGERAASLTQQLLAFSRQQIIQPKVVDFNALVTRVAGMLQRLIGEDITLVTNLTPSIGSVKVDPGQFEQVIVNLAINARDAMPEGGTLTIETAHVKPTQPQRREQSSARSGPAVCLFVRDTGQGMDSETRARIFEPFFTTKEVGKGTGLGLAMVYGVVTQSGGTIEADSEPGTGTTFTITLPQIQAATPTAEAPSAPTPLPTGTETILVVEDDPTVRAYVREVLTLSGYQVLQAAHTEEALRVCSSHAGPIHLLLTDVVMPGINGRRLAELVAERWPETHVMFMSGYPKHATIRQGSQDGSATLLQKPLAPDELVRAVRTVLTA